MESPYRNKPPEVYVAEIEELKLQIEKLKKPTLWTRIKTWWNSWKLIPREIVVGKARKRTRKLSSKDYAYYPQSAVLYTLDGVSGKMQDIQKRIAESEKRSHNFNIDMSETSESCIDVSKQVYETTDNLIQEIQKQQEVEHFLELHNSIEDEFEKRKRRRIRGSGVTLRKW